MGVVLQIGCWEKVVSPYILFVGKKDLNEDKAIIGKEE